MIVKDIKVTGISTPLNENFMFSQGWVNTRSSVIVEVITEDGISGWGECLCHGHQPPQIAKSFIEHCYKEVVIGRSIFDLEVLWEEMYNRSRPFGQMGVAINAISGIDIALWDAIGRTLQQPISKLLGGRFREKVSTYATGFYRKKHGVYPQDAVQEAKMLISHNFNALKVKVGFGVKEDIHYIKTLRDSIDDTIQIMADFNCAYNQALARRILKELESEKIYFFEELLSPEDMQGYRDIRNISSSYIAAGENIFGKIAYKDWISQRALDIIQPDICSCGGISDCKKISSIAQAYNTMIIPHVWGSAIGMAASLQFIANIPSIPMSKIPIEPMLEYDTSNHPFRKDITNNTFPINKDGTIDIPTKPGLGVEINREVLHTYSIE